jgi:surface protein
MFFGASVFNQPINNWNVAAVTSMADMFRGAGMAFQQPLNNWAFTGTVSLLRFMNGRTGASSYNTTDYNDLLVRWDALVTATTLAADRSVDMGGAQHSGAGTTARANLVAAGWTISDGGAA